MRLKNKVAIVTGGGKGREISLALSSEGASVVVAGRTLPLLGEVVKDIQKKGGQARYIAVNADRGEITLVEEAIFHRWGRYYFT
jgi:NAD(P)-dependent dehydrogenase (short-subunit alcohol dehydrogenase family)